MIIGLYNLLYFVGLPMLLSWAFLKFVGKSIVFVGAFAFVIGFFMMIAGIFQYFLLNFDFIFKWGAISFVFGFLIYLFGGMLIISDPAGEANSILDNFIENLQKKSRDKPL
jgi:hypothetical protein